MAVWKDIRFGLRQLRKSPAFTAIVLATLGLCIGANTAIYSVLDAVLLRPAALSGSGPPGTDRDAGGPGHARGADGRAVRNSARWRPGAGHRGLFGHHHGCEFRGGRPAGGGAPAACFGRILPRLRRVAGARERIHARRRRTERPGAGGSESRVLAARAGRQSCRGGEDHPAAGRAVSRDWHHAARVPDGNSGGCVDTAAALAAGRRRGSELHGNLASACRCLLGGGGRAAHRGEPFSDADAGISQDLSGN